MATKKDAHLTVRISPEELEEIKQYANTHGMQQSEFVLTAIRAAMGKGGLQEQYLQLASRLASIESRLATEKISA
jgi:uncharacterized protein (DUF1778 family)